MKVLKRPKTLTERAVEILRNSIINNKFMLGEPLSEKLLSESMGISKSPVREALAQLKAEGLVTIIPQKGTFVFTLTPKELSDLTQMRLILESAALRMSFEKHREDLIKSLRENLSAMQRYLHEDDLMNYLNHDTAFHLSLFEYCDNSYLREAYSQISGKSAALRVRISKQPRHPDKTFREHLQFVERLEKGDVEEAIRMLDVHFSSFEKYYRENIDAIAVSNASSTRKARHQNYRA